MVTLQSVCATIRNAVEQSVRAAATPISALILLCSLAKRPGLSTIISVANISKKMTEKGIPLTPELLQFTYEIVNEVYRGIREDAYTQIALPMGGITVQVTGSSPAGPVTAVGSNINPVAGLAQMR